MSANPTDPILSAALQTLQAAAQRAVIARQLQASAETALLQTVVDAAAMLFDSEAASIALFEREPDRLVFRVAAGVQGKGVVGLEIPPTKGIVGYVFSSSQPIAISDVMADPRFDKATAQKTGYVPRSIAAVPLVTEGVTVGVMQVLDKRSTPTFTLQDMNLMEVFSRQAAAAIEATKTQRDTTRLLRAALAGVGEGIDDDALDALIEASAVSLDRDADQPFWKLVDQVARLRGLSDRELTLVTEILGVVARQAARPGRRRFPAAE